MRLTGRKQTVKRLPALADLPASAGSLVAAGLLAVAGLLCAFAASLLLVCSPVGRGIPATAATLPANTLRPQASCDIAPSAPSVDGVFILQSVLGPALPPPEPPVDPGMHAFFIDYLVTKWKLRVRDAENLATWVLRYSRTYEVDPMVQLARILKESRGRHYRLSSRGGAYVVRGRAREIGYSQIMPFWAGKQVEDLRITREMLFDPEGNIRAGIALYKRYRDDAPDYLIALSQYNHPGARRPNSYARAVDRIHAEIQRCHVEFLLRQPSFYRWAFYSATCEGSDGSAFNWTQAFTLDFSDYPRW